MDWMEKGQDMTRKQRGGCAITNMSQDYLEYESNIKLNKYIV